jgi:cephalosporin hydroxylase
MVERVRALTAGKRVLVIADSDHEKNHVLAEIHAYSPMVHVGGYFVVEDSLNDVMGYHPVPNEGPKVSLNPNGFLLRVK